jgi:hypothetical protein
MLNVKKFAIAVLVAASLTSTGGAAYASTAPASAATETATTSVSIQSTWTYYLNYFTSKQTCENRWGQIRPGGSQAIPGVLAHSCYRESGDTRWSMDILFG